MTTEKLKIPIAFVLGAPRSGTTLLRVMLAGHPQLFSPPEMVLAIHETMEERKEYLEVRYWEKGGLRRALMDLGGLDTDQAREAEEALMGLTIPEVYQWLSQAAGDRIVVDKCPHLALNPEWMERLETWFDKPRYLWIMRHPGSVIRSLQNMPMAEVMLAGYSGSAEEAYISMNRNIQGFLKGIPRDRWTTVIYEDLVRDPRPVMEEACRALGVPFNMAVLDPYEGDRMREGPKGARAIGDPNLSGRGKLDPTLAGKWLEGYDPALASPRLRELATELGYDLDKLERPPITRVSAALDQLWEIARDLERNIKLPMDLDNIEGRRFLMRMVAASWDMCVEEGDPDRPRFIHAEGPTRKMFADNPDADYLRAPLKVGPGRVYRIRGKAHPDTVYFAVLLYGKGGRVAKQLRDDEIKIGAAAGLPEGGFEVLVSTEPQPGSWLQADPDIEALIVRQYYFDRKTEKPIDLEIEFLGEPGPAQPLEPIQFAQRIEKAKRMLKSVFKRTIGAYELASQAYLNKFGLVPGEGLFPTPDNKYTMCWFRFGYNQVMHVTGRIPDTRYFNLSLVNAWMESYDYLRHPVTLNSKQIKTLPDGTFEVLLAHRDMGHENWLDTAGHHAGYLIARHLCLEGEPEELKVMVEYESEYLARKEREGR